MQRCIDKKIPILVGIFLLRSMLRNKNDSQGEPFLLKELRKIFCNIIARKYHVRFGL